jgi:hypothetical protein
MRPRDRFVEFARLTRGFGAVDTSVVTLMIRIPFEGPVGTFLKMRRPCDRFLFVGFPWAVATLRVLAERVEERAASNRVPAGFADVGSTATLLTSGVEFAFGLWFLLTALLMLRPRRCTLIHSQ